MADTLAVGSSFTFDAIGTRWCVDTDEPLGGEVRDRILDRIRRFDRTYSRFRPDSLVAQVAAASAGGRFAFPEDSVALFELYDRLVAATDGAVDPLVGRQLELLGYDPTYSLTRAPDAVRAQERARARPSWTADVVRDGAILITRRPLVIDVGAAGRAVSSTSSRRSSNTPGWPGSSSTPAATCATAASTASGSGLNTRSTRGW